MRPVLASLLHAAISGVFLFGAGLAAAVPYSPTVVSGAATLQSSAGALQIASNRDTIINWNAFDIGAGTATTFVQSSASGAVLNRILSSTPTGIYGELRTNGGLILINPAGFFVAPGARIYASSLTLSTLNLSNLDFLAGRPNFVSQGGEGPIVIEGTLNASVTLNLYAPNITMSGPIQVPPGTIVLPETPGVIISSGGSGGGGIVSIGQGGSLSLGGGTIPVNIVADPGAGGGSISIFQGGSLSLGDGTNGGIITLQSPVPEPSSYALFLAGLACLGALARRRTS
jgi:filamentous hemagglutinin family protein